MATRTDISVDFDPSPRIAIVASPSTEFNAQDIVDTLRIQEFSWRGQSESKLLNASGKENLGGGVQVGITVELQDTQVAFEGRTTPAQTGNVTTASDPPVGGLIKLFDSGATFQTNNIARGSLVINFTDRSVAEVFAVDTENELTTRTLVNGTDNSFDIGDNYHVYNIQQCEVLGGNVTAVDDVGSELNAILPTPFTQVVKTASSSATLLTTGGSIPSAQDNATAVWEFSSFSAPPADSYGELLRTLAFEGNIRVDAINGAAGTAFPLGTHSNPVNNIADAVTIGLRENILHIRIIQNVIIQATDVVDRFLIEGCHPAQTKVTVLSGASTVSSRFFRCTLTGALMGHTTAEDCVLESLTNVEGTLQRCMLMGNISLTGTATSNLLSCYAGLPVSGTPEIDCGSGRGLTMRDYAGDLKLVNKTGPEVVCIDFVSGKIILDSTVTDGNIILRGTYRVENNSTGTTTMERNTNLDDTEAKVDVVDLTTSEALRFDRNRTIIDKDNFTMTVYGDDEVTPIKIFDLKDENGVASVTRIFERVPRP